MSVFSVFNNCTVEVGTLQRGRAYGDDELKLTVEKSFGADFQPYNGGLAQREYGVEAEVSARIYAEPTDGILKSGKIAVVNGAKYDIIYVTAWEFGEIALLRQRKD